MDCGDKAVTTTHVRRSVTTEAICSVKFRLIVPEVRTLDELMPPRSNFKSALLFFYSHSHITGTSFRLSSS